MEDFIDLQGSMEGFIDLQGSMKGFQIFMYEVCSNFNANGSIFHLLGNLD